VALAEPSRLTKPLPGGHEGATVVLHPMICAHMDSPPELMSMTRGKPHAARRFLLSRKDRVRLPIPAFLVEHPGAGPIIIDTGFHPSVAHDPKQNLGPVYGRIYSIDMRPEEAIATQLREQKGIDPHDVRIAIMTHLHMDHASAISEFTSATYVLGMGEWRAFHSSRLALNGYVRHHVQHAVEYKEVPYDSPVIDSYGTFGRSFDLFGDGSVRLVYTPGHTHGHQSVILRLKNREALVAGDAIYFLDTLDDERRGWVMADEHKWRRSVGEIRLYRRENPDALIIPGHDPRAWAGIAPRYE
jgi:glyoxylase-like metal-dependent hydrolase (beta-lactamase superfamily II)